MTTNQSLFVRATNNAAAAGADIRALKPPVAIPDFWLWVWIIVAVLVVIVGIVVLVLWLYSRNQAKLAAPAPVVPPHERARLKLQEALALLSQPRPFCILVSDTVRQYLEERFSFHAPDRTTEEFLHELKASELLLPDQKESLGEFLSVCDMVKFARYEPGHAELEALHQSAVRLIDETEPQPAAPETATPSQP